MTGQEADSRVPDRLTSRRNFFKMLAGSPLLAMVSPGLPRLWQHGVEHEWRQSAAAGQTPGDLNVFIERQLEGQMIESVDEAVNVWDFEQVAHANNLPQHWAYLHMG